MTTDTTEWWIYKNSDYFWAPMRDHVLIETAFQKGSIEINDGEYRVLLPLMVAIQNTTKEEGLLIRNTSSSTKPIKAWQYEESYGKYAAIADNTSNTLSIARRVGYKHFIIRNPITLSSFKYDFHDCTQTNEQTGTIRTIIPAPNDIDYKAKAYLKSDSDNIPDFMLCPITHALMNDPVMAQDGHSYERNAIENWFATGKITSPVTGETLITPRLYSNHILRNAISMGFLIKSAKD